MLFVAALVYWACGVMGEVLGLGPLNRPWTLHWSGFSHLWASCDCGYSLFILMHSGGESSKNRQTA